MKLLKISYLLISFLLVQSLSFGQKTHPKAVGLGLVKIVEPNDFREYKMPPGIFLDLAETKTCTANEILPFYSVPEVGVYNFVCLEVLETKFKVLINDTEEGYISKNSQYEFESWDVLLMNHNVMRFSTDNAIRLQPTEDAEILPYDCQNGSFKVEDVIELNNEHWLKVNYSPKCKDRNEYQFIMSSGYIKWRTADELLVTIFFGC